MWAYIVEHGLPYLSHYDDMRNTLGIDYEDIRYCTPFSVGADGMADNTALKMVTYCRNCMAMCKEVKRMVVLCDVKEEGAQRKAGGGG